jgi:hypothetical protein
VIFDPKEVLTDTIVFGTMVSERWDTRVTVTHHTSHIVLDEKGMALKQVLQDIDGGVLCERAWASYENVRCTSGV